ncbi:MAG: nitroreductase family protein [Lactobacillales bacterium]|jgi:predicted oxidoreductase (fatty acid repression mutant protein)|nr:nitroreductase family protein [Lactobacillales bacterium]
MTHFIDILKKRRSIYDLNDQLPITKVEVEDLVKQAVRFSPSAFNSQSTRAVFLWNDDKDRFWKYTEELLQPLTPEEVFPSTQEKLAKFKRAALVILFFEDQDIVNSLQEHFPLYADNFPAWSEQASGIATVNTWVALSELGMGCNLQHYNPVVNKKVATAWNISASWKLRGQLVVGGVESPAGEKDFVTNEKRFKSFGGDV